MFTVKKSNFELYLDHNTIGRDNLTISNMLTTGVDNDIYLFKTSSSDALNKTVSFLLGFNIEHLFCENAIFIDFKINNDTYKYKIFVNEKGKVLFRNKSGTYLIDIINKHYKKNKKKFKLIFDLNKKEIRFM